MAMAAPVRLHNSFATGAARLRTAPAARPVAASRGPVRVNALFGLGGGKAKVEPMICLDCGYIYTGPKPWAEVPANYKCPKCSSGKNRFKKAPPKK